MARQIVMDGGIVFVPDNVDEVLEYANLGAFPGTGVTGKLYIAQDTSKTYRWNGSAYVEISAQLALGETSSTAYRGDRGATAYSHSQATHAPTNAQKNSDISKAEIEAKLTGEISSHTHQKWALDDYYIATTGNDTTGNGTVGSPWATLQKALDEVNKYRINPDNGDCVIHLAAGTYTPSTTIKIDHPDAHLLKIFGNTASDTFIESTASGNVIEVQPYRHLWYLANLTIRRTTYGGTQTAVKLLEGATITNLSAVNIDKTYRCVNLDKGSFCYATGCNFTAYAYALQASGEKASFEMNDTDWDGTGGAASPTAIECGYGAHGRVASNCIISNNNIAMYAYIEGRILDSGANVATGNTTTHSPTKSTPNTITYGNTFGSILDI